jgi:hypothetical protein
LFVLGALAALAACDARRPSGGNPPAAAAAPAAGKVEFMEAPAGEVAPWVQDQETKLRARGRTVLVYEGATWCEPCQRFHEAARSGKLDGALADLTLLEFDADRDAERLAMAGYMSNLIPLFAAPGSDGRASGKQIEGGIKGNGSVDELVGRLRALTPRRE